MSRAAPAHPPARLPRATHLHGRVDLQYLLLAFDLPDADLAGELRRGVAVSLQREGTLQGTLVTGPHLRKGELLPGGERWRRGEEGGRGWGVGEGRNKLIRGPPRTSPASLPPSLPPPLCF